MVVLGKAYKENTILVIFLYFFLLIAFIAGIICLILFLEKLSIKIILISLLSLLVLLITYIPYNLYKCKKTSEDIIIYNVIDETITINKYKKNYIVNVSDVSTVTVHNIGMHLLFANRMEEGKIYFYLNDGTIIKTPELVSAYDAYDKLDEILFKDREYDEEIKDQLVDKLDGWGSKKEYPAIVSILVSLFIPFFGLWFVQNQKEYKELKYGKSTGLMGIAITISALWVFIIIVIIYLI